MRFLPILAALAVATAPTAEAQSIPKAASLDTLPSLKMTVKERRRVCALVVDDLNSGYASQTAKEQRGFLGRCMTKDCDFLVQFIAAQKKRQQGATPVGVFSMPQKIDGLFEVYPFLKKDDFPAGTAAGIAEVRDKTRTGAKKTGINLLFLSYCNAAQGCVLRVYVDSGAGYKKASLDETETMVESISWAEGEVSLFFGGGGGRIGGAPPSREYTLRGERFERTEPHEGC
jgi:hypothetical protein